MYVIFCQTKAFSLVLMLVAASLPCAVSAGQASPSKPSYEKPKLENAYCVRVLEIPTPRWSSYDAVTLGVKVSPLVPVTIQERSWSSPIWYMPITKASAKK